ncbi:MAG: exonuclease subunit SbcD [Bacteroidota bacterium]
MTPLRILHTADWHLGKRLDHISRLPEQHQVLDEMVELAEREEVDIILVAGDLFDHANPSIEAIELLYKTLKRLSSNGHRLVVGIAGNHDAPDRIQAPDPLARDNGILLLGYPESVLRSGELPGGWAIRHSVPGYAEITSPRHPFPFRLLATPYANALRLKKFLPPDDEGAELRELLATHWQNLAATYLDEAGANVLMTHLFFMRKGEAKEEESDDERSILTVGGAQEVFTENLPAQLQYAALGHLHRAHFVQEGPFPVAYSGSILSYSMSEAGQQKSCYVVEVAPGKEAQVKKIPLSRGKTLHRKKFDGVSAAVEWLQQHPDTLVELTLNLPTYLSAKERKLLYEAHDGIVTIIPFVQQDEDGAPANTRQVDLSQDIEVLFQGYFQQKYQQAPHEEVMKLFQEILSEPD